MALRDAEGQGAGAPALLQLLVGVSGSGLGGDVAGELLLVEAGVAPGDVPVVDLVWHAKVPEAAEEVLPDALDEVAAVDEVLLTQGEEVAAVGALRRGGEGEQELRAEVVDEAAVRRGRGVVELVHHDVVEGVAREALQVGGPAERLDRREQDVGVQVALLAHVEAEACAGADPAEGVSGLVQDLLAVRDEKDPAEALAVRVEGAQPGLAEAGGEDDEAGGVALLPCLLECSERLMLDGVRGGDVRGLFRLLGGLRCSLQFAFLATLAVRVDPLLRELARGGMAEQAVECRADLLECGCVGFRDGPVVPLDAGEKSRLAEVGAADERNACTVRAFEDVGLWVEDESGRRARELRNR